MFWKRKARSGPLPKAAVCCVTDAASRAAADRLTRLGLCRCVPLPSQTPGETLRACLRERPDLLFLEAMPDAMERLDDPDKDIAGRCELSALVKERLPGCQVCLWCGETFRHLTPALEKAVRAGLIDGYRFGSPASPPWPADERPHKI